MIDHSHVPVDREKLFVWMREIQAYYMEQSHDEKFNDDEQRSFGLMAGVVLAMGLEIKSGRFDYEGGIFQVGDADEIYKDIDMD